jgi:hypothetical protein
VCEAEAYSMQPLGFRVAIANFRETDDQVVLAETILELTWNVLVESVLSAAPNSTLRRRSPECPPLASQRLTSNPARRYDLQAFMNRVRAFYLDSGSARLLAKKLNARRIVPERKLTQLRRVESEEFPYG